MKIESRSVQICRITVCRIFSLQGIMSNCNDSTSLDPSSDRNWKTLATVNPSDDSEGKADHHQTKHYSWNKTLSWRQSSSALYLSTLGVILLLNSFFTMMMMMRRRGPLESGCQKKKKKSSLTRSSSSNGHSRTVHQMRKRDFVSRAGDDYGYAKAPSGHIDKWRSAEFPSLIAPLTMQMDDHDGSRADDNLEVFLDYAGTALPSRSQLRKCLEASSTSATSAILANPHSSGPAASRTSLQMQQSSKRVLDHFHGHPGRNFGGMMATDDEKSSHHHVGYELAYTSGTTEALRIVAERFPFTLCAACGRRSKLLYSHNSHTSVVGMRGPAIAKGGTFTCATLSELCDTARLLWEEVCIVKPLGECGVCHGRTKNLLVLPTECNFGGDRPDVASIIKTIRNSNSSSRWYIMLDLAKAASTGPIDLVGLDPDFACVSFYKMFGEPTGLGGLFVKRSSVDTLMGVPSADPKESTRRHYFGGGSVDAILPRINFSVPRSEPSWLASLAHGTPHFRGIVSLVHGFDELERLGGMDKIFLHAKSLARELTLRLRSLRHGNGKPVVLIYGAWSKACLEGRLDALPGPTVPFNIVRSDGSFVGYNEVSKLAALNRPPLQFRTGCFCNPGACQDALELGNQEIQTNYFTSGHVCGDQIDILNDKPTGAIRASFGKDSIWEDLDALVHMIDRVFVDSTICDVSERNKQTSSRDQSVRSEAVVREIYIFPIKSCAAQQVKIWALAVDSGRLRFDREFALVDSTGSAMRLQAYPQMSQIRPTIDTQLGTMTVTAPRMSPLLLRLEPGCTDEGRDARGSAIVKVCGNRCGGRLWGDHEASEWFSSFLGVQCWLARHFGGSYQVAPTAVGMLRPPEIAFANEAPLLLISEHSVVTLNRVLSSRDERSVESRHFRPNFVVRSCDDELNGDDILHQTNPEDRWSRLTSAKHALQLEVAGPCARCAMVDVDPDSGKKGKTLRALADYRRDKGQIMFGVFLRVSKSDTDMFIENGCHVPVQEGDVWMCSS